MERAKIVISTIGEQPKPLSVVAMEGLDKFFRSLPFFLPWVWKLIAIVGIIGFAFGMIVGHWADWSLAR